MLSYQSPYNRLFNTQPTYTHLRTFGCVCFVHLPPTEPTKLSSQSGKCAFLGYASHQKGFLCYDPVIHRICVSRNVFFFWKISLSFLITKIHFLLSLYYSILLMMLLRHLSSSIKSIVTKMFLSCHPLRIITRCLILHQNPVLLLLLLHRRFNLGDPLATLVPQTIMASLTLRYLLPYLLLLFLTHIRMQ